MSMSDRVVYKYRLEITYCKIQTLRLPPGSVPLSVGYQPEPNNNIGLFVWVEQDSKSGLTVDMDLLTVFTGDTLPAVDGKLKFVGTANTATYPIVTHVYRIKPRKPAKGK